MRDDTLHRCTARTTPFPVAGGEYQAIGGVLVRAGATPPVTTKQAKPAAPGGPIKCAKEHDHG